MGRFAVIFVCGLAVIGCSSSGMTGADKDQPPSGSAEFLYRKGHDFFQQGEYDSSLYYLEKARAIDPNSVASLRDLAEIRYLYAYRDPDPSEEELKMAFVCYQEMESLGDTRSEIYERLTEISYRMGEKDAFLLYSKKYADKFPGDRQAYNLGLAYSMAGDDQHVIETQKEAIDKYSGSPFAPGFYRLLGDAYFHVGRQQSAERTYEAGVAAAEDRLADYADPESRLSPAFSQLAENREAMLHSLLKIYRIHGNEEEIRKIEKKLAGGGY